MLIHTTGGRNQQLKFCTLSSCSYANSVVIQSRDTCVLIDCGLRKRDIKPFLDGIGLAPGDIDAVLVTHCHTDHIYGLKHLLKQRNVPVYSTAGVLKQVSERCTFNEHPGFQVLKPYTEFKIGGLSLTPFNLSHDVETVGYTVSGDGERMGFMTDTGFFPEKCRELFNALDYLYIESNHDVEMYKNSAKPWHVKKRNLGPTGHLSNEQCGQVLQSLDLSSCRLVMLGHLSEDDNKPSLALQNARQQLAPDISLVSAPSRVPGPWSDTLIKK
jgi:phosphoribosyl 1,2-cyclic phosphodiesterase